MYGLRSSPRRWQQRFAQQLEQLGLRRLKGEPNCYVTGDGTALILVYVDVLLTTGEPTTLNKLTTNVQQRALLKTVGTLTTSTPLAFLGRQLTTGGEAINIGVPTTYITDILKYLSAADHRQLLFLRASTTLTVL